MECEPMDVDTSLNSLNYSKDERTTHDFGPTGNVQVPAQLNIEAVPQKKSRVKKFYMKRKKVEKKSDLASISILLSVLILCFSLNFYLINFKCSDVLDLLELRTRLVHKIYDQDIALNNFIDGLNDESSKLLVLYGGTGVGKTLTVSILLEDKWNSSNVYHYTMPSFLNTFSVDTLYGMNIICKTITVVIEDLKQNDMIIIKRFVNDIIKRSQEFNKKLTIILVFNCDSVYEDFIKKCDPKFSSDLDQTFYDIDINKKFILYQQLSQDTLRRCIETELRNKEIDHFKLNRLLKEFNVELDGCKGVTQKIKFLNSL